MLQQLHFEIQQLPDSKKYRFQVSLMSIAKKIVPENTKSDVTKYDVVSSSADGKVEWKLEEHNDNSQFEIIQTAPQKNTDNQTFVTYYLFRKTTHYSLPSII